MKSHRPHEQFVADIVVKQFVVLEMMKRESTQNQIYRLSLIPEFWSWKKKKKKECASIKYSGPSLVFVVFIFYIKNLCVVPKRAKLIRDEKSLILNDLYSLPSL